MAIEPLLHCPAPGEVPSIGVTVEGVSGRRRPAIVPESISVGRIKVCAPPHREEPFVCFFGPGRLVREVVLSGEVPHRASTIFPIKDKRR